MKAQPTTKELIAMLYERLPEFFDRSAPVQEPVVAGSLSVRYFRGCKSMINTDFDYEGDLPEGDYTLCTAPPTAQRQAQDKPAEWVGLTDEEALTEAARHLGEMHVENCGLSDIKDFARAIEAKLKEKNQ